MKKTSWKTLAVLFSIPALALIAYGVIHACAGGDWEGYDYDSSFTPEVYVDESYAPLFYTPSDVFYGIGFDAEYVGRFNDDIVADWSTYLKGRLTTEEVSMLLIKEEGAAAVDQLYTALQKKQTPPAAFSRINLVDERVKGFIVFLHLAKEIEASSTVKYDWDYDESKKPPVATPQTITRAEQLYAGAKDEFLKNRYWFQAMKANFYSANKLNATIFFDKTKNAVPQNTLYYRGLAYVAGVAYQQKQYATSNYLYSIVFDKCPVMRVMATYNFHPQEESDFQAALALAKSADEKATLRSLFGYYADEKVAIREIYKLSPKSTHLDYLLTRLINKEEIRLNSEGCTSADDYRNKLKQNVDQQAVQLVTTLAKEGKTEKPYLWNLAAGYLSIFNGDNARATQYFDKAEKEAPKSDLATAQLRILRLINTMHGTTRLDATAETRLLPELEWLYKHGDQETLRSMHVVNWSKHYLASLYRHQNNIVLGELFDRNRTYYRTASNLEAMKAFLQKNSYTPWEKLALSLYDVKLDNIFEYEAIMAAYAGNLDNAIALMQKDNTGVELYGNPFNGKIQDCHDCDHAATQKIKYTKLSFLQKMKEMQAHVDKNEDVYNNSLLLANAYYNMSYFGNARAFYYNNILNQYYLDIDEYYAPQLLTCTIANRYYKLALTAATTDEQRAKCVYMMAKCERNEKFNGDPENESLAWEGFKQLKTKYANTKYYKEVLNECSYFSIYLNRGH
ncbi:hypothetical protein KK062_08350 [Fulvivirgaceae bacterium PWU5]|uniref:Tetratricopeptide repeat protein n=1 Tax=Dawidia cretensis TaxID=2782350 RepID=A0AAP2DVX9_9BACT|nr:hypothetical protein [Dawidia cretensis]MBT1708231.1 hypothetical protein [Dawidia cretensis]